MLDNYVTIDQLKPISALNDQCRIIIDDSTGGDTKVTTVNTLKTYTISDIEKNVALKADKTELHTHNNKDLLDKLSTDANGNLSYNSQILANTSAVNEINTNLIYKIYPIGSIYMSVNNVSPASFLGGAWQAINSGYMLKSVSANAGNYSGSNTSGSTAISIEQMPQHGHTRAVFGAVNTSFTNNTTGLWTYGGTGVATVYGSSQLSDNAGGNQGHTHSIDTPAFGVYMWVRIG